MLTRRGSAPGTRRPERRRAAAGTGLFMAGACRIPAPVQTTMFPRKLPRRRGGTPAMRLGLMGPRPPRRGRSRVQEPGSLPAAVAPALVMTVRLARLAPVLDRVHGRLVSRLFTRLAVGVTRARVHVRHVQLALRADLLVRGVRALRHAIRGPDR